ncbi:MAG TPA: dihydrolipoamide acetyltransferase family protein [Ktedonobacteraceae bacterium]|jgi:pyruvate dehydrogenase E2 component (dihydrolipoamide acetyltransferase)
MNELKLADLGEGIREAEIVEWLVTVGESVRLDQPVVRVETDKAIVEIPSPVAGRVSELRFQPGQTANVGEVLLTYDTPQAHVAEKAKRNMPAPPLSAAPALTGTARTTMPERTAPGRAEANRRVLAAPAVRKLAFELGVDLTSLSPSAPSGRISKEDVQAYVEQARTAPGPRVQNILIHSPIQPQTAERREPLSGLRKGIAEHMERSWRTIPHATAFDELDARGLVELRRSLLPAAEQRGVRLTYLPLLIKLLISPLKAFPIFNASLDEEKREIVYKNAYHLGVATASPEGLLVPVVHNADRLSIIEMARRLETLIEGAHKRTLAPGELRGSTFTLNNVGSFGGSSGTPIINYPEVAILAVGKIEEKAVVHEGQLVAQARMPLALAFDHRLIDGALAGAFLARFKELAEHPEQLLLDLI